MQKSLLSTYLGVIKVGDGLEYLGGQYSRRTSSALAEGTLSPGRSLRIHLEAPPRNAIRTEFNFQLPPL